MASFPTAGDDLIVGTDGQDFIDADEGNDTIYGRGGNDELFGWRGDDFIDGGAGDDWLFGEGGTDRLTGGAGNDIFGEFDQWHNGDTITDFSIGDIILIRDADIATFTYSLTGTTLTFGGAQTTDYQGGTMTLLGAAGATLAASASPYGGVQITMIARPAPLHDVRNDINNDVRSDLILRNVDLGWLNTWAGFPNGSLAGTDTSVHFPLDWKVAGTGDYNGDGRDDLLLRSDSGWLTNWLGTAGGGLTNNGANTSLFFAPEWKVAGNGDFNGDGRADLLLRRDDGWLTNWLGTSSGSFMNNGPNTSLFFTTDWKISSTGDFNGDGYTDILLRRDDGWVTNWLGNSSGGFTNNGANTALFFTLDWKVIGTGDINGDGRDDLVLRRDDGWITDWLGTANGGFTNNGANTALYLTTDWKISSIADFNGDGREDIFLRNDSGWVTNWLGTATGSFTDNSVNFATFIAPDWVVQDPFM